MGLALLPRHGVGARVADRRLIVGARVALDCRNIDEIHRQ